MRDKALDNAFSDDEMRICDRLAGWACAIILGFDLSIVLVLLYSYLAPHPRLAVVSTWTWTTLIGAAVGLCALLIWLSRQPAFGRPQERPTEEPSGSH